MLLETLTHLDDIRSLAAAEACRLFLAICVEQPNAFSGAEIDRTIGAIGPKGLSRGLWVLERKLLGRWR